jgi:hypothetical protein
MVFGDKLVMLSSNPIHSLIFLQLLKACHSVNIYPYKLKVCICTNNGTILLVLGLIS